MTKIKQNPYITDEERKEIIEKIKQNDGYCPCALWKDDTTKCMCLDFRKNVKNGPCHCGLYIKSNS